MKAIQTLLRGSNSTTSAHKIEETKGQTVFSRRADSSGKLFSSLKNLFSRAEKSQAREVVTQTAPQAALKPVNASCNSHGHVEFDQRTRVRMAYREFLDPSGAGLGPRGKGQGYEEKVSHFDSTVLKVLNGSELKEADEKVLDKVFPEFEKAVKENLQLNESKRKQLLSDFSDIKAKAAVLQINSIIKRAYQGS